MLKKHLRKLALQKHLSLEEMQEVAGKILIADPLEAAVFLALLSAKGPTAEEIVVFAQMLRGLAKTVSLDRPFVDIVGTGGDGAGTRRHRAGGGGPDDDRGGMRATWR